MCKLHFAILPSLPAYPIASESSSQVIWELERVIFVSRGSAQRRLIGIRHLQPFLVLFVPGTTSSPHADIDLVLLLKPGRMDPRPPSTKEGEPCHRRLHDRI